MNNKYVGNEIQNAETKNEKSRKRKSVEEDQFRVVISKETNEVLEALVVRVNEGFEGGDISKSDVANQILLSSSKSFSEADIKALRAQHFDEKKMLRAILRTAGDDADIPEHIKKAIREHYGLGETRKRNSKAQPELSTEQNVDNSAVA